MVFYESLRTENFSNILNDIHQSMNQKMKMIQQEQTALEIESILREIKHTVTLLKEKSNNSALSKQINNQLADLIQQTYNTEIYARRKDNKFKLGSSLALFHRSHHYSTIDKNTKQVKSSYGVKSISNADDIFEEELAFLIKAAAKTKKKTINVGELLIGNKTSTMLSLNNVKEGMEDYIIEIINEAAQNQVKKINFDDNKVSKLNAVVNKADLSVPATIAINVDRSDLIGKLLHAVAGKKFTLKNYKSKSWENGKAEMRSVNFHLGKTNIYKTITGALSEIMDVQSQQRVFWRGMNILSGRSIPPDTASVEEVNKHFGHLNFIYELRGSGILDSNGNSLAADFFIWNDPDSDDIKVRSVPYMILKNWEDYADKAFSAITLSASKL